MIMTKVVCSATLLGETAAMTVDKGAGTFRTKRKYKVSKQMEDLLVLLSLPLAGEQAKCACIESTLIIIHHHREGAFTAWYQMTLAMSIATWIYVSLHTHAHGTSLILHNWYYYSGHWLSKYHWTWYWNFRKNFQHSLFHRSCYTVWFPLPVFWVVFWSF